MKAGKLNGQITIGVFSSSSPVSATVPVRYDRGIEYLKSRGYEMIHGSLQGKQDFYRSGTIQQRAEIVSIADIFRAKIVDAERESLVIELTGTQSKLEAFLQLLDGYEILELARTGIAGLSRGIKDVTFIE